MVKNTIIEQYLLAGIRLMPLNKKIPKEGWRTTVFSDEQIYSHKDNIGWQISHKDLIVDIDPRNGGDKSFIKLAKDLNLDLTPTVVTPRSGQHIYLKIPEQYRNFNFKKNLKEYPGIDFLTEGCYCLIVSCKTENGTYEWADDLFGKFEQHEAPKVLLDLISYEKQDQSNLGDFEGLIGGNSSGWSEEKVLEMLSRLDASMGNDEWVKVGMALHDWDPVKGLELWEDWSKSGDNYQEGETEVRWRSFDVNGGVTLGTISYMVKGVIYDETTIKVTKFLEKIKIADEKTLEFDIFPKIKKENFSKINIEKLAKATQDRFKEIANVKIPISNARQLINGVEVVSGSFIEDGEIPEWCKDWVYVNSHAAFASLGSLKLFKTESFNIKNGKYVPDSGNGSKQSAARFVADKGFIDTVDAMAYLPNCEDSICQIEDFKVLNSFNSKTVPEAASEYTEEGLAALELVKKHVKFICTTDKHADIFLQWLAHCVQFPGKQILWSPVIQSIQGVGKSFFGELLRSCLGDRNVGTVSPTQVVSDFNGWATNVSVNVLEELRVKGHNRYDAVNSLKPLVTDRMIQINDKGVKQYMTYNTTNYICFTNYKDAIPLDQDDRRWWVIFVPIESLEEMPNYVGESVSSYFPKLFGAVRKYGPEIRKWLLEYKLTEEFLSIKQAPMTDYKLGMIATEEAGFEGYSEIKELIEKGGEYYNSEVICSNDLFEALMFENPELDIQGRNRHAILKKLGYTALPKTVKLGGKMRRVWAKKIIDNEKVRKLLEL
jgi:hypothetical protein